MVMVKPSTRLACRSFHNQRPSACCSVSSATSTNQSCNAPSGSFAPARQSLPVSADGGSRFSNWQSLATRATAAWHAASLPSRSTWEKNAQTTTPVLSIPRRPNRAPYLAKTRCIRLVLSTLDKTNPAPAKKASTTSWKWWLLLCGKWGLCDNMKKTPWKLLEELQTKDGRKSLPRWARFQKCHLACFTKMPAPVQGLRARVWHFDSAIHACPL